MNKIPTTNYEKKFIALGLALAFAGVILRLFHITQNDFFFYDEGLYLNYNRSFVELLSRNMPVHLADWIAVFKLMINSALSTAKALWFFMANLRVFFGGADAWSFLRVVSSVCGIATLGITFLWARRFFTNSRTVAFLSLAFLAILPSHVFYSRLAMQEAFSAMCFVGALYLYLFPRRLGWRMFVSALVLSAVFFANYRMIVAPIFIVVAEIWISFAEQKPVGFRRLLWYVLTFYGIVFGVGALNQGSNTLITFAWMFHQADAAKTQFDWINLCSYPYYLFRLESAWLGILFFGNLYFIYKKNWRPLLPFVLVCVQMGLFSFAAEKGARYVCVVLPFVAVACAALVDALLYETRGHKFLQPIVVGFLGFTLLSLSVKSIAIAQFKSDYRPAMEFVQRDVFPSKIISTQPLLTSLYVYDPKNVASCPKRMDEFLFLYSKGFQYLILDPQVFVSWTQDERRFAPPLINYLEFIRSRVPPTKVFAHLNRLMLERFVFDHNENLRRSIEFLKNADNSSGAIQIYDVRQCLILLREYLSRL